MHSVYTVGQLNAYIKNMFAQEYMFRSITVKGEVSNCKYHSSGHIYFTLKDQGGQISCVMFAGNRGGLKFQMTDGSKVQVTGSVEVYERDGKYQLYAKNIEQLGAGELYEQFLLLKKRLEEQGMFDAGYKRQIPKFIHKLGVVTAPTGAAVQDIINISLRRNPYLQIILYPAIVQGEQAAASIARGISALSERAVDVIIVGRGGGSIEDLWAFNEESVAEAIFNCPIPIISAVGHETDTTIADYVADLRAPTPSAAAELAVYEYDRFMQDIYDYESTLATLMDRKLSDAKVKGQMLGKELERYSPDARLNEQRMKAVSMEDMLSNLITGKISMERHRLDVDIEIMKGLSPLSKLQSGFSYVTDSEGRNIKSCKDVNPGDDLIINVSDGIVEAVVTKPIYGGSNGSKD